MLSWLTSGASSSSPDSTERNPLVLPFRVPRSYGSVFPYYRFMRDALGEALPNEVTIYLFYDKFQKFRALFYSMYVLINKKYFLINER